MELRSKDIALLNGGDKVIAIVGGRYDIFFGSVGAMIGVDKIDVLGLAFVLEQGVIDDFDIVPADMGHPQTRHVKGATLLLTLLINLLRLEMPLLLKLIEQKLLKLLCKKVSMK